MIAAEICNGDRARETGSAVSAPRLRTIDTFPIGFLAHAMPNDDCAPLIRRGEVAVVSDEECLYPEPGTWYLIEDTAGRNYFGRKRRKRRVAIAIERNSLWWTVAPAGARDGVLRCADGPYPDANALAEKILGEVVGVLGGGA